MLTAVYRQGARTLDVVAGDAFLLSGDGRVSLLTLSARHELRPLADEQSFVLEAEDTPLELVLDGVAVHTSSKGFVLERHGGTNGTSLIDKKGGVPLYHSYGFKWQDYGGARAEAGRELVVCRPDYLAGLGTPQGPRVRISPLGA